ncbi:MAG: hypothetical protein EXR62_02715 [Chloroflexi bacterium]|nr:hypothetical protein [Chloroflexota bacterium]
MKILSLSDQVVQQLHTPAVAKLQGHADIMLSCGDLPHGYLEYIVSILGLPLHYVHGNHARKEGVPVFHGTDGIEFSANQPYDH